ncbi:MAG: hypothetical protein WDO71_03790 [Bacteroidota bacterium]
MADRYYIIRKPQYLLAFIITILVAVLVIRCLVWINHYEDLAYFNLYTFSRIDGICIGCMLALLQKINSRFLTRHMSTLVLFFAGLNFVFYFINRYYQFSFPYLALVGFTTFAMLFGLLVYEAVKAENKLINTHFQLAGVEIFWQNFLRVLYHSLACLRHAIPIAMEWSSYLLPASSFTNAQQIVSSIICTAAAVCISVVSYQFF